MEGKSYRGSRGGAKSRKKKFYERQDYVRKLLRELAARCGQDYNLPRIEYDTSDPTVASIEEVDWELVQSLDTLVVHVLACTVPSLKSLLDQLELSVDRKPRLAPGDGPPSPRPWQVAGAAGGPPNPLNPNAPTHEDWDAVREDPALAARLAQYDPDEGDAAEGAPDVDLEPAPETAAPEPAEPFLVPEADLVQVADDPPLGNEEAVDDGPLVNQGGEVQRGARAIW